METPIFPTLNFNALTLTFHCLGHKNRSPSQLQMARHPWSSNSLGRPGGKTSCFINQHLYRNMEPQGLTCLNDIEWESFTLAMSWSNQCRRTNWCLSRIAVCCLSNTTAKGTGASRPHLSYLDSGWLWWEQTGVLLPNSQLLFTACCYGLLIIMTTLMILMKYLIQYTERTCHVSGRFRNKLYTLIGLSDMSPTEMDVKTVGHRLI